MAANRIKGITIEIGGDGQRYKLWKLVGGELCVEGVLTFTRRENFLLDIGKVICYLYKRKVIYYLYKGGIKC